MRPCLLQNPSECLSPYVVDDYVMEQVCDDDSEMSELEHVETARVNNQLRGQVQSQVRASISSEMSTLWEGKGKWRGTWPI